MNHMKYKDYLGSAEISHKDGCLHGKIVFIDDLVTYESESVTGLRTEFETAVDDYLETCKQVGKEPERPFSGTFQIRVAPEIHRQAAIYAKIAGQSLNEWVGDSIERRLCEEIETSERPYPESSTERLRLLREAGGEKYYNPSVD
ncbi:MAG: type II toxin-antitoxin system HicB family antitoxin [Verrucomicrobia bacterium]|nr:type II toxin-antitoxin system HicB family antitoxin [Verrucomicrobiota bacterium]